MTNTNDIVLERLEDIAIYLHAVDMKLCAMSPVVREIRDAIVSLDEKTKAPAVSVFTRDPDSVSATSAAASLQANHTTLAYTPPSR